MESIVSRLLRVALTNDPQKFKAWFVGGIIANTIANLPDKYWSHFLRTEICSEPGCSCHEIQARVIPGLDVLRDDHKKTIAEAEKAQKAT